MITGALSEDCESFLQNTQGNSTSHIIAADSPDFPIAIRSEVLASGMSPKQLSQLSQDFVASQRQALGKIIPNLPDSLNARLIYLPITPVAAFAVADKNSHLVVITSGLYDLLRSHSINSVFIERMEKSPIQTGELFTEAEKIVKILNLCTVLFMSKRLPSPLFIEEHINDDIVQAGCRLAEVSLLFVILHEFGHAHFKTLCPEQISEFGQNIQLKIPEQLTETKIEEFFADAFALGCLDKDLSGPLIHASLVFFVVRAFVEASDMAGSDSHPLAINRIWQLINCCDPAAQNYHSWTSGILRQMETTTEFNTDITELYGNQPKAALDELAVYAKTQIDTNKASWLATLSTLSGQL